VAYASEPDFLVLHALRLKGFAESDLVAEISSLDVDEVGKRLESFEADELVKHRSGRVAGWTLTAAGRARGEEMARHELEAAGASDVVEGAYSRFLEWNQPVLQLCTDWQMRDGDGGPVVNDHADATYDDAVVARLADVDRAIQPVCVELAATLDRFAGYDARLARALERTQRGEKDWFTKPTIDSYHTVWFELHENLLATLGVERGKETS
jgi:hypothetical protein